MEIKIEDIKDGQHFWVKFLNGEIAVAAKIDGSVYGCGQWEDPYIPIHWFKIIEIINIPKGYEGAKITFSEK